MSVCVCVRLWLLSLFLCGSAASRKHASTMATTATPETRADCDADRDDIVWGPACLFGADDSVSVRVPIGWDMAPRSAAVV